MEQQNSLLNTQASLSDQFTGDPDPKVKLSRSIPTKVKEAYKLFVQRPDGQLLPLFVNAANPIPVGQFIEADFPTATFTGKSSVNSQPSFYVPTKGAERSQGEVQRKTGTQIIINSEQDRAKLIQEGYITEKTGRTKDAPFGKVTAVAARPGFHASVKAYALHLGPEDLQVTKQEADTLKDLGMVIKPKQGKYFVKRRAEDQVFAKVAMADDVDYQSQIDASGRTDINDRVPLGGSYIYKDGQANQDWVVGGDMRIDRVLSREEAQTIAQSQGVRDLPYKAEVEEILGRKLSNELPSDIKFSAKKGITDDIATEDLLITVHNLSPEALVRADRLGGIPMPSIGIAKPSVGFEGFGEISLIGNAKMATPSGVDQVYKRDAYTTRAPKPEFEATNDAIKYMKKLKADLKKELEDTYNFDLEKLAAETTYQMDVKDGLKNVFNISDEFQIGKDVNALNKDYDSFNSKEIYLDEMTPILRVKYLNDIGAIAEVFKVERYRYEESTDPNIGNEKREDVIADVIYTASGIGYSLKANFNVFDTSDETIIRDWLLTEREML